MVIKVNVELFNYTVIYIIDPTQKEINKYKLAPQEIGEYGRACQEGTIVIYRKKDEVTYGIIAHETFHAVVYLCKSVGISFSEDSEEIYAYLIHHIINSFYKKFSK